MATDLFDDLFDLTPEQLEKQRKADEKRRQERKRKIQEAVKKEHLEVSIREYKKVTEGETSKQTMVLFLATKKGIYDEPDTLGRMEFTLYENADLKSIFIAAKSKGREISGRMEKLLHFDKVIMYSDYRRFGLSEMLLSHFFDLYQKKYSDYPISIEYMYPVAEYVVQKVLKNKGMKEIMDEKLIQRFYYSNDEMEDISLINSLKEKDAELFPLETLEYISEDEKRVC